jgi:DNA-binding NarL/FixJ family response regulator
MKCLLASPDLFWRRGVAAMLGEAVAGTHEIEEATSVDQCIAALSAPPRRFDLIVVDCTLPGARGTAGLVHQIKRELARDVPMVVVVWSRDFEFIRGSLPFRGLAVVLRDGGQPEGFLRAVAGVLRGEVVAPPVPVPINVAAEGRAAVAAIVGTLAPIEDEVLGYLAEGASNKAIGAKIGLSERRVKEIVTALLRRFGVSTRTQLIARLGEEIHLPYRPRPRVEEARAPYLRNDDTARGVRAVVWLQSAVSSYG